MEYYIALCAAVLILAAAAVLSAKRKKRRLPWLMGGVGLALICMILPFSLSNSVPASFRNALLSVLNVLKIFGLDGDYPTETAVFLALPSAFGWVYSLLLAALYLFAPLLTLSVLLSVLGNLSSRLRWAFSRKDKVVVLSCVNERTVTLAESMGSDNLYIFCAAAEKQEEYTARLSKLRAVAFPVPVTELHRSVLRRSRELVLLLAKDDEQENLVDSLTVVDRLKAETVSSTDPKLFVFSTRPEMELLLDGTRNERTRVPGGKVHIQRIDEARAVVYDLLHVKPGANGAAPWSVFDLASGPEGDRELRVLIVGCGHYGTEMLKALPWCCIREGYRLQVNVIESRKIKDRLTLQYPELLHTQQLPDAAQISYRLQITDETDLYAVDFESGDNRQLYEKTGFIFVCLGTDEANLRAAIYLREVFTRLGTAPHIVTCINELGSEKALCFCGRTESTACNYKIHTLDRRALYSASCLLAPEIQRFALKLHGKWNKEDDNFFAYDYYYRSSMAQALFWQNRQALGLDVRVSNRNMELEHQRWNAYMRSEGFRQANVKNPMARQHPLLGAGAQDGDRVPMEILEEMQHGIYTQAL